MGLNGGPEQSLKWSPSLANLSFVSLCNRLLCKGYLIPAFNFGELLEDLLIEPLALATLRPTLFEFKVSDYASCMVAYSAVLC